jgi:hypothetical protein
VSISLAATLGLSVYPQPVFDFARHAVGVTNAAHP